MTRQHLQREWNLVLMLVHQRVAYVFKISDLPQMLSILENRTESDHQAVLRRQLQAHVQNH
jgi:hypothetical protein